MTYRHIEVTDVKLYLFLTSALDRKNWSTSCHSCFVARKEPQAEWAQSHTEQYGEEDNPCPCWD